MGIIEICKRNNKSKIKKTLRQMIQESIESDPNTISDQINFKARFGFWPVSKKKFRSI